MTATIDRNAARNANSSAPAAGAPPTPSAGDKVLDVAADALDWAAPGVTDLFAGVGFAAGVYDPSADLAPGQSVKLEVKGDGTVEGVTGEIGGGVTVAREDDGAWAVEAELAAGVAVKGEHEELSGKVAVGGGVKMGFRAGTHEEVDALLSKIRRDTTLAAGAAGASSVVLPGVGPVAAETALVAELAGRATSVESHLDGAASGALKLFEGKSGPGGLEAALGAGVAGSYALRVEVDAQGRKTAVLEERALVSGELKAEGALAMGNASLKAGRGASQEAQVIARQTFALPDDFDMRKAPFPGLVALAASGPAKHEMVLKTKVEVAGSTVEGELTVGGSPADAVRLAQGFVNGDTKGLEMPVSGTVTRSLTSGGPVGFDAKVVSAEAGMTRTTQISKKEVESLGAFFKELGKAELRTPLAFIGR